jgi:hypothetical protein
MMIAAMNNVNDFFFLTGAPAIKQVSKYFIWMMTGGDGDG